MDKAEEKQGEVQKEPRCDPKQLALLKKCSEKKDITEWKKWRKEKPVAGIWLEGADLVYADLKGANLLCARLERAKLWNTHLERVNLGYAHLEGSELEEARLERADLKYAHLEGADLSGAHFERANLISANLKGASFLRAHLERGNLSYTHLEGADLQGAYLSGANFTAFSVDSLTLFWECSVDRKTDFRGVGLDSCRIYEGTKYLLEYNKRRLNWEDWYKQHPKLTWFVKPFWCLSDYGRSTIRILIVFLALAIVFALAYWIKPDCVIVNGQVGGLENFLHALYFSVVTMTTLGFGDIAANPQSSCGQVLLMLQVFCGYFLLGAIVTRLSILFTAGGPAGKFSKRSMKKTKEDE